MNINKVLLNIGELVTAKTETTTMSKNLKTRNESVLNILLFPVIWSLGEINVLTVHDITKLVFCFICILTAIYIYVCGSNVSLKHLPAQFQHHILPPLFPYT